MSASSAGYRPGECNIGTAEIARRRRSAWAATLATLVLWAILLAAGVPHLSRFVVAVPAAAAGVTWLQVRERFCVAFGSAGVFNFGSLGPVQAVGDEADRRADRRKAASMIVRGLAAGLLVGVVAVLVP